MPIVAYEVKSGEYPLKIADNLGAVGYPQRLAVATMLAYANGYRILDGKFYLGGFVVDTAGNRIGDLEANLYPGQILWYQAAALDAILGSSTPTNTLAGYADRLNARCQVAFDAEATKRLAAGGDPNEIAGRRAVAQAQLDSRRVRLDWLCDHLAGRGINPDTFDLNERFDPDVTFEDHDGPQNLVPGTILENPRFNGIVQHQGDENSEPTIFLNAYHTGIDAPIDSYNDGTLFRSYGNDAPTIFLRALVDPVVPNWKLGGFRGHHMTIINADVRRVVDGLWPMDTRTGVRPAMVLVIGMDVRDLAFFAPTPGRPEGTHTDVFQHHGSQWFTVLDSSGRANKDPNVGQGGIVDLDAKWMPAANACYQLSAPKAGDPPGDLFFAFNDWSSGMSGFNLSSQRELLAPITFVGDIFQGDTYHDADMIIPSNLRDGRIQLFDVSDPDGGPISIKNWN